MYYIRSVDGSEADTYDTLRGLHTEVFADSAPQIDPSEGFWWIAYGPRGEAAGFAGMSPSEAVSNAGYMSRAGVLKEHRGHGLQLRLIRVRERAARKMGWQLLRTDTTGNVPSSNNLIKAGFRMFKPEVPWGFDSTLYWHKAL
jgi:GNAT superfamily N-acetyltransferase